MVSADVNYLFSIVLASLYDTVPTVLLAIFLLLAGWILGKIAKRITEEVMKKLKADTYFKLGKRVGITEIVSLGVSWVIYLVFIGAAIDTLKIASLSSFFLTTTDFIINLLGGILILIVGYVIATFVQKKVLESKVLYSQIFGQIVFLFTIIITIEMALKVVGLPTDLLDTILIIIIASIALGLAIALGLGLKDTIARLAKKHLEE